MEKNAERSSTKSGPSKSNAATKEKQSKKTIKYTLIIKEDK